MRMPIASNSGASHSNDALMPADTPLPSKSFDVVKQIDAGSLNVGYAEAGPTNGAVVADVVNTYSGRAKGNFHLPSRISGRGRKRRTV
jgi:hypothetical protein